MSANSIKAPIFPLPNIVFFPGTLLPLHVFEPRYKSMVSEVLRTGTMMGVVQLKPGWDEDYFGAPPVYRTMSVGHIVWHRPLDDGRYDILVEGLHRARIVSETTQGNHRAAEAEILDDITPPGRGDELRRLHASLELILHELLCSLEVFRNTVVPAVLQSPGPGATADLLAHGLLEGPYEKQCILDEVDVLRRLQLVQVQLRTLLKQE
jgi:hypothetical protein